MSFGPSNFAEVAEHLSLGVNVGGDEGGTLQLKTNFWPVTSSARFPGTVGVSVGEVLS